MNLKRFSLLLAICLVCVATAMASTTCPSQPPSTINWQTYLSLSPNNCITDNLQFSQFSYESGGSLAPAASTIGVMVLDPAVTAGLDGPGFTFDPGFAAGPGESADASIDFEVTALSGTISDLFINFNGSVTGGTGDTSFSETFCTGSFTTGCQTFAVSNPPPGNLTDTIFTCAAGVSPGGATPCIPAGTTTLFITKDFSATGETGLASISSVTNEFSTVPEPREIGLLILAMVGLVFAHRRFKTSVN